MNVSEIENQVYKHTKKFLKIGVEHAEDSSFNFSPDSIDELEDWIEKGLKEIAQIKGFDFEWNYFKNIVEVVVKSIVDIAIVDAQKQNNLKIEIENIRTAKETHKSNWPDLHRFFESVWEKIAGKSQPKDSKESSGSELGWVH